MDGRYRLGHRASAHCLRQLDQERAHPLGDGTSCSSPRHRGPLLSTATCRASHAESAGCPGDSYPATRGCGVRTEARRVGQECVSKCKSLTSPYNSKIKTQNLHESKK